jgi:hypothetical protein
MPLSPVFIIFRPTDAYISLRHKDCIFMTKLSKIAIEIRRRESLLFYIGFEVLTAVAMKSIIFWDITPCSPLKVNRLLGGSYRLHLQGRRISRARNQRESCSSPAFTPVSFLAYSSTLKMEAICSSETSVDFKPEVHKIPTRVQCTVQVCELVESNLHPPPPHHRTVAGRSSVSLTQSPFVFPSICWCGPPLTSYMPGRSIPCTAQQHTSLHTVRCARLVHLCFKRATRHYIPEDSTLLPFVLSPVFRWPYSERCILNYKPRGHKYRTTQ